MATVDPYQTDRCVKACGSKWDKDKPCRKDGHTNYMVRYRKPDGKQTKRRGFIRKKDADDFRSTVEVQKMNGDYIAPSLGQITVGALAADWLARKEVEVAQSNYRTLETAWRVHVKPRWADSRISDIDLNAAELWIAEMGRKGSGATVVIRAYGVLAGILDSAVKGKRLRANPVRGVENLPKKLGKRHVYLTAADVGRLADESGQHRALVLVLAYCGLRWGEAIALRVRDVEFLRRRLTVADNAVQLSGEHAVGPTKGRRVRSVPVPVFVLDELAAQCEGKERDSLVFPRSDGEGYLPRTGVDGWFAGAVKRADVQRITPHDLRHSCASLAVSAGVNVLALARMLGHKDPAVTLRVYANLFDTDLDRAADVIHAAYGPAECAQHVPTASA